ncbi:uncharacterized protein [Typha angustifolia]|uniref:uncharacterized protein n=1 Tax=Typha angustifolia TaxID=59011 RepID=UPI003C2BCAC7
MAKRKVVLARRAWRLACMAVLWAKRHSKFKCRLMVDLHLALASHLRSLRAGGHSYGLQYGELREGDRELSFDETPTFRFKLRRPRFPCIDPGAASDDDRYGDDDVAVDDDDDDDDEDEEEEEVLDECERVSGHHDQEGGVDRKAEEFIAKFYKEMRLQRQISLLQYNEMLQRGVN